MFTIKGTLRHSRKGGGEKEGFKWRGKGRVQSFKKITLRALIAQQAVVEPFAEQGPPKIFEKIYNFF